MKKIFLLIFMLQCMIISSQSIKKEVAVLKKVLSSYVDYIESNRKVDKNNEILISYLMHHPDYPIQIIGASFFDMHLLTNTLYTKIFDFKGYKLVLVSNDIVNFEKEFGRYFKERKFENINKSEDNNINWEPDNISIELNDKSEIISINPENKDLLKNLIDNKLTIAKDCLCLKLTDSK